MLIFLTNFCEVFIHVQKPDFSLRQMRAWGNILSVWEEQVQRLHYFNCKHIRLCGIQLFMTRTQLLNQRTCENNSYKLTGFSHAGRANYWINHIHYYWWGISLPLRTWTFTWLQMLDWAEVKCLMLQGIRIVESVFLFFLKIVRRKTEWAHAANFSQTIRF